MNDLFGKKRNIYAPNELVTSEQVVVSLDGRISLGQQLAIRYSQQVINRHEMGSSDVLIVSGKPTGVINLSKLVSAKGFLAGLSAIKEAACGKLLNMTASTKEACTDVEVGNPLYIQGIVPSDIGIDVSVDGLIVTESVSLVAAYVGQDSA